jgi:hypothetical protein
MKLFMTRAQLLTMLTEARHRLIEGPKDIHGNSCLTEHSAGVTLGILVNLKLRRQYGYDPQAASFMATVPAVWGKMDDVI